MKTDGKMEASLSKGSEASSSFAAMPLHFWERFKDCLHRKKRVHKCWKTVSNLYNSTVFFCISIIFLRMC